MSDYGEDDYIGEFEDLNLDRDPNEDLKFHLFEHKNAAPTTAQGEVKSYHVKQDSHELYADQQSDYSITVQRLLWIDGHEKAKTWTVDPQTKQDVKQEVLRDSTLVVLKIQMHSMDPDQKFQWMTATLELEDGKRHGKNHPEIQAWAPWRTLERRNETVVHSEAAKRVEAGVKVGYQGAEISTGASRERKISWEQTYFDEAHSTNVSKDGKSNGVTWFAKQNKLQDQGVTPELWVSALFSRSSPAPYLVKFHIYAHAGKLSEFAHNTKRFFGLGPGRVKTFSITPGKQQIITREGEYIREGIDVADFGKLRDKELPSRLKVTWSLAYQQTPIPPLDAGTNTEKTPKLADPAKDSAAEPKERDEKLSEKVSQTWAGPETAGAAEYARLVALEGRVANTEARIAAQDKSILQLQRELMTKDVQLAKMEQAIHQLASLRSDSASC